jgi:hypothetical protein
MGVSFVHRQAQVKTTAALLAAIALAATLV